jgi:hypothetical protein
VISTILTLLAIMVLLAGALLAQMNASSLHAPFSMSVSAISATPLSNLRALAAAGGVVVLLWFAGMIDLIVLRSHVRRRDALLMEKDQEIARVKASAYDQEQPALEDVKTQLTKVALNVDAMMIRLRAMPTKSDREVREEIRTITPERSTNERVAIAD